MSSSVRKMARRAGTRGSRSRKYTWRAGFKAVMFLAVVSVYAFMEMSFTEEGETQGRHLLEEIEADPCNLVTGSAKDSLLCVALAKNGGRDALTYTQIQNGGFMLYIIGIMYMFVAIAIVCDDFFVPALEILAEKLKLSNDVAGATLMAAGGSAPELFTSYIGTFSDSPVGFGTIVGSAVFNVLFVIAMCAVFSKGILVLTWWPLFRDSVYYTICLLLLAFFFMNEKSAKYKCLDGTDNCNMIEVWEACIMFVMYIGYVSFMTVHSKVHAWIENCIGGRRGAKIAPRRSRTSIWEAKEAAKELNKKETEMAGGEQGGEQGGEENQQMIKDEEEGEKSFENIDAGDPEDDDEEGFELEWPEGTGEQVKFLLLLPLTGPMYYSMYFLRPSRSEEDRNQLKWGVLGFLISILWIGVFAFLMVWWTEIVGARFGIPIYVMGITFLAAGTSVPDLLSSVVVAKMGHGDMAVSSSIGSNIFDVTVGLPLPWLTYLAVRGGQPIEVRGRDVAASILTLVAMLAAVIFVTALSGWRMTKKLGAAMFVLYIVFLIADLLRYYL